MKRIILILLAAGISVSAWSQCSTACDPGSLVTWYLDIDGDGYGVDFAETNQVCCAQPSDLYAQVAGDPCPSDPNCTGASDPVKGCIFEAACNYNAQATVFDGFCIFADGCQECELDDLGNKTGILDPDGPCRCEGATVYYPDALGACGGACLADADDDGICDYETILVGATNDTLWLDDCRVAGQVTDDCGVCNTEAAGRFYKDTLTNEPCVPGTPNCFLTNTSDHCGCDGEVFNDCDVCGGPPQNPNYNCDGTCIDLNSNSICDYQEILGCTDATKCNYDASANVDDGSCLTFDVCGLCGGTGIPTGQCDCEGNLPNPGYTCAGACLQDTDGDGVCDEFEVHGCTNSVACNYSDAATEDDGSCILEDALGVCDGPCTADVDGDGICDSDLDGDGEPDDDCLIGNGRIDDCGVCGGGSAFTDDSGDPCTPGTPGCTNQLGACDCDGNTYDAIDVCGGGCTEDADDDGVCDDVDLFICSGTADAVGECNGTCLTDADGDGLCDDDNNGDGLADVDPCLDDPYNFIDECGVCGGDGIPVGACDCAGGGVDAVGVCGGTCTTDADGDGICDDGGNDSCVGVYDECGDCAGTSYFTFANGSSCDPGTPGCTNAAGFCNCEGDTLDAIHICGGDCPIDADGDGICDVDSEGNSVDPCVGSLDACGVCNGPGAIYDCGCSDIPSDACDCDYNVLDDCGVCGGTGPEFGKDCDGNCLGDADGDGICDVDEELFIPRVLHKNSVPAGSKTMGLRLDNIKFQEALDQFTLLHHLMSENLDDGSLTGSSRILTIEKSIVDKGTLQVEGSSTFNTNMHIKGMLAVYRNVSVTGSATIGGATLSRSGIVSTDMTISGAATIQGGMRLAGETELAGPTAFRNSFDISNDFRVYDGSGASSTLKFHVASSTGDVAMKGTFTGDDDLHVDGYTQLDRLHVTGQGTLDNATVDDPLTVGGIADWQGNVLVGDTALYINATSGDVQMENDVELVGDANIRGNVTVQGSTTIAGTTFANGGIETKNIKVEGDMDVAGHATVGKSMDVGRHVNTYKTVGVGGDFAMYKGSSGGALSTVQRFVVNAATGNATAAGTLTARRLNANRYASVGLGTDVSGSVTAGGIARISGRLVASGNATFLHSDFLQSGNVTGHLTTHNTLTTGALTGKEVTVNAALGHSRFNGTVTVTQTQPQWGLAVSLASSEGFAAKFQSSDPAGGQGIIIQSGTAVPGNDNNYVEFYGGNDIMMGRIEGVLEDEVSGDSEIEYIRASSSLAQEYGGWDVGFATVGLGLAIYDAVSATKDLIGWSASVTGCFGNGACATAPVPSLVASAIAEVALAATGVVMATTSLADAGNVLALANQSAQEFESTLANGLVSIGSQKAGVTYQSGSGDYAEWLPKADPHAVLHAGQIVGMKNGHISLETADADHMFVISTLPVVLGNAPEEEWRYEKAAFLGQVPVHVRGAIHSGDYVLASGLDDGYGIGVSPEALDPEQYDRVIGMAWETGLSAFNTVNVAVGLNDVMQFAARDLENRIERMELETRAMKEVALSFVRGDQPEIEYLQLSGMLPVVIGAEDVQPVLERPDHDVESWMVPGFDDIVVHQMTDAAIEKGFEEALAQIEANDMPQGVRDFYDALAENDGMRAQFLGGLKNRINDHNRKALAELAEFSGMDITKPVTLEEKRREIEDQLNAPNK